MSCNGCRVLRKGCSKTCMLRSCLQWIGSPQAQGNATLFLAKFFGRSDLMSLISAAPQTQRPALFQSLLFEACGRTVNPVNGAVGLLSSGNWRVCQAAVETVLAGGALEPLPGIGELKVEDSSESMYGNGDGNGNVRSCMVRGLYGEDDLNLSLSPKIDGGRGGRRRKYCSVHKRQRDMVSCDSDEMSEMTTITEASWGNIGHVMQHEESNERKMLNLFV